MKTWARAMTISHRLKPGCDQDGSIANRVLKEDAKRIPASPSVDLLLLDVRAIGQELNSIKSRKIQIALIYGIESDKLSIQGHTNK
jgi:hypothetical protein